VSGIALQLKNIHKSFGSTKIIDGLDLEVRDSEVFTLLGPSGCGKSTTLRIIAGLEEPDDGEVIFKGKPWVIMSQDLLVPAHKRNIGVVFQNYAIWPHMTVFENVAYPLRIRGEKKHVIYEKVRQTLSLVGLGHLEDRPAPMLSGGQQQRVSIARSLVYEPSILLLDEPFSNLDAKLRERMRLEVKQLQEKLKLTIIFVTHDHLDAFTLSDRIGVMRNGKIEQIDSSLDIYELPKTQFVRDFVGNTSKFKVTLQEKNEKDCTVRLSNNALLTFPIQKDFPHLSVGQEMELSFRPEDVKVYQNTSAQLRPNQMECIIENAIFLGNCYECLIQLDENNQIILFMGKETRPKKQERILIEFNPQKARIWEVLKHVKQH